MVMMPQRGRPVFPAALVGYTAEEYAALLKLNGWGAKAIADEVAQFQRFADMAAHRPTVEQPPPENDEYEAAASRRRRRSQVEQPTD